MNTEEKPKRRAKPTHTPLYFYESGYVTGLLWPNHMINHHSERLARTIHSQYTLLNGVQRDALTTPPGHMPEKMSLLDFKFINRIAAVKVMNELLNQGETRVLYKLDDARDATKILRALTKLYPVDAET